MIENDPYRYFTITETARAQIYIRGSRFIGTAAPAPTEEEARQFIEEVKAEFHDATHNAFAYRIGAAGELLERFSDDREPAGTAGPPMLQLLQGAELSDIVVVGSRYFGGVKLGIGGLIRAYRACAAACLEQVAVTVKEQLTRCRITAPYSDLKALQRHIQDRGGEIIYVDYTEEVTLTAAVPGKEFTEMIEELIELSRGRIRWEEI